MGNKNERHKQEELQRDSVGEELDDVDDEYDYDDVAIVVLFLV